MLLLLQSQEEENTPDNWEQSWHPRYIISQNFRGSFCDSVSCGSSQTILKT